MIIRSDGVGDIKRTQMGDMVVEDTDLKMNPGGPFIRYLLQGLLDKLIAEMHQNITRDYDNIVVIEGGEGSGKSNLACDICTMFDPNFDIHSNLVYTLDELEDRLMKGNDKGQIFWLDEYYDIGNKRDWNKEENKRFNKLLVKMRSRGWSLIMCIPRASDSDSYVRDHRSRYVITCEALKFEHSPYLERGYFQLQRRSKEGHLRHIGYGKYPQMPDSIREEYDRYKDESQTRTLTNDRAGDGAKYRAKYEYQSKRLSRAVLLLKEYGVPKDEIMYELGIKSDNTYYGLIKRGKQNGNIDEGEDED